MTLDGGPGGNRMRRLSWDKAQRRRCILRWQRAGSPIPNRLLDAGAWWPVFSPWRVKLKRRRRSRIGKNAAIL